MESDASSPAFFNSPIDGVQPRSAIGYNDNGDVIIPKVLRKWMGNQEIIEAK